MTGNYQFIIGLATGSVFFALAAMGYFKNKKIQKLEAEALEQKVVSDVDKKSLDTLVDESNKRAGR
jgi:hypothetical protein